ncbi:MAG TPA: hypothetical protein VF103_08810, partial [Polyangiaceae bacterium]
MVSSRLPCWFLFVSALAACGARPTAPAPAPPAPGAPSSWGLPWVARTGSWPSPACSKKAEELLSRMTLAEKVGQMTQAARDNVKPGEIQKYVLGSVLSGGGSAPGRGTPEDWIQMLDSMHGEAIATRLGIPL